MVYFYDNSTKVLYEIYHQHYIFNTETVSLYIFFRTGTECDNCNLIIQINVEMCFEFTNLRVCSTLEFMFKEIFIYCPRLC